MSKLKFQIKSEFQIFKVLILDFDIHLTFGIFILGGIDDQS